MDKILKEQEFKEVIKMLTALNMLFNNTINEQTIKMWSRSLVNDGYTKKDIGIACNNIKKEQEFLKLAHFYKYLEMGDTNVNYFDKLIQLVRQHGGAESDRIIAARGSIRKNEKSEILDLWNEFGIQVANSDKHSDRTFLMNSVNKRGTELQKFHKQQEQKVKLGYVKREEIDYKNSTMHPTVKAHYNKMMGEK